MDIDVASVTAAAFFAKSFVEGFAGEMGRAGWERLQGLLRLLRGAETRHPSTAAALRRVENAPDDEGAVAQLAEALRVWSAEDPEFARNLIGKVEAVQQVADVRGATINISGNARVRNVTSMGDVHGDVRFS